MDLSFHPLTLEAVDQAAAESLCLFIAADERPLTGLAGLADWRLSGKLSRLLRSGLLTGDAGEAVLTPPGARMAAFQKLFLFGVGRLDQSEDQLAERVIEALRKLAHAGVQEVAMQLPARLPVESGIRALVDELQGPGRALVFAADPQKLVGALSQAASRGQANLERRVVKVPPPPPPVPVKPPARVQQPLPQPQRAAVPAAPLPAAPVAIPKASPLPFAPQRDLPAAEPLPAGPSMPAAAAVAPPPPSEPPIAPAVDLPVAPAVPSEPAKPATPPPAAAAPEAPGEEKKPAPPPPQRYVPPPPKPHVFDSKRKKKH